MVAQNIIMTVLNVIGAGRAAGVRCVRGVQHKPNFELTPAHLYDQQMGQKYGIWVFICVIISWLVTLPGLFGPLSNTWNQILWWVELIFNIATLVFCVLASFYYSRLNTRPHD